MISRQGLPTTRGPKKKHALFRIALSFLLLPVFSLLTMQGCVPLFLAAGAGAGYIVTDKKAARKFDRFLHDLAGSITTSAHRIAGSRQTARKYRYRKGTGATVRLQKSSLEPKTVGRGDKVTGVMIYAVLGAPAKGMVVREKRELWFNGHRLSTLQNKSIRRENGTWKSRLVFKVPQSALKGTYELRQQVSFQGKTLKATRKFTLL
ncbi:MAG TPA: hypothetical protein ENK84_11125 [Desulfobulbus sp.]|nr:hypothetical protein [Desulfobulbus sp.]